MRSNKLFVAFAVLFSLCIAAVAVADDDQEKKELGVFFDKGYLVFQSEDGDYKYWIDGRIMLDVGKVFSDNNEIPWGTETRRVRLAWKTIIAKDWAGELDINYADNEMEIKDLWLAYIGFENTIIKFGNHKLPGSMEELTSSRYISFLERGLLNAFAHDRRIGASITNYGNHYMVQAGVFGEAPGKGEDEGEDEAIGWGVRGTFAPLNTDKDLLHIGASWSMSEPEAGSGDTLRFRGRELHLMDRFINTGKVKHVEDYNLLGFEAAYRYGPVSVQGEFMKATMNRTEGEDAEFSGYYAFVSWFPMGGTRSYDKAAGEFAAISNIPAKGALELLARYSNLDLNDADADVLGGEGDYITLGANYYFNRNVKFMVNYILTDHDEYADADGDWLGDDDHQILSARIYFVF